MKKGAIEKVMSKGDGLFLKGDHCYEVQNTQGDRLFLTLHEHLHEIPGIHGSNIYDGSGLIWQNAV